MILSLTKPEVGIYPEECFTIEAYVVEDLDGNEVTDIITVGADSIDVYSADKTLKPETFVVYTLIEENGEKL